MIDALIRRWRDLRERPHHDPGRRRFMRNLAMSAGGVLVADDLLAVLKDGCRIIVPGAALTRTDDDLLDWDPALFVQSWQEELLARLDREWEWELALRRDAERIRAIRHREAIREFGKGATPMIV